MYITMLQKPVPLN